jgi:PTS system nitrogen regulatory IIA component
MSEETITIESILTSGLTQCGLPGGSKKKVLEQVALLISKQHPELEEEKIFESLITRERLGSTGIGQGIAIPHSRLDQCDRVIGGLFTLEEKIPFDAIDNEPVDILFVLLVPTEATSEHLELLSQIAEKFNQPELCQQIRQCKDSESLYKTIIEN